MKKQLQEKLNNYKANLSRATFEPAAVGRFGLAGTAALASMLVAPVELNAQTVCGDMGAPTRTVGPGLSPGQFQNKSVVAKFDFDDDGVIDAQIEYRATFYSYTGGGYGSSYRQANATNILRNVAIVAPRAARFNPFSMNMVVQAPIYHRSDDDITYYIALSGGDGIGFLTFDIDLYSSGIHPVIGKNFNLSSPGVTMWGAQSGQNNFNSITNPGSTTECPTFESSLPVELTSFSARANAKSISLDWSTATETANAGFEVERSVDGENFRVLQFVEGQGDATEANQYSFEDQDVVAGNEYLYRLKQINFDGTFQYSEVVSAELLRAGLQASVFPNPVAGGSAQLRIAAPNDEAVTVTVFNGNGQRMSVATESVREGSNRLSLDLSDLTAGIYFVKLEQAGETTYEKFVVE